MSKIRCGNHKEDKVYHETVADVRACYAGGITREAVMAHRVDSLLNSGVAKPSRPGTPETLQRLATQATRNDAARQRLEARVHVDGPDAGKPVDIYDAPAERDNHGVPFDFGGTDKQWGFLVRLVAERELVPGQEDIDRLTFQQASNRISALLAQPKKAAGVRISETSGLATEDGIYRDPKTGEIFKGQFNKAQGDGARLYFKRLVLSAGDWPGAGRDFEITNIPLSGQPEVAREIQMNWVYAGGAAKAGVRAEWRVTRAEAEKFGRLYGVCIRCHRDLTREESIDRAMGPICAGKMGW